MAWPFFVVKILNFSKTALRNFATNIREGTYFMAAGVKISADPEGRGVKIVLDLEG